MIKLIMKIAAGKSGDVNAASARRHVGELAGGIGIFLNFVLFGIKITAGILSGSSAITADAFNNLSDAGSSVMTLIGFKMSGKPADRDHPFGHGRIEYVAGLMVSIAIIIMGFELVKDSASKLGSSAAEYSPLSVWVLIIAIAVKLFMYFFNRALSAKIDSAAIGAAAADSLNDSMATFGVLAAIVINLTTDMNLDAYIGLIISALILAAGIKSVSKTVSPLLGQAADPELVRQIEEEVMSNPHILGIHDMIIHNYGPARIILSLHAEVDSKENVLILHDIIDDIENSLRKKFSCDAVIHMDPIVTDDERVNTARQKVSDILKNIDISLSMHDFRMTDGHSHTNLIFDVVAPFAYKMSDDALSEQIKKKINEMDSTFFAVISIERAG